MRPPLETGSMGLLQPNTQVLILLVSICYRYPWGSPERCTSHPEQLLEEGAPDLHCVLPATSSGTTEDGWVSSGKRSCKRSWWERNDQESEKLIIWSKALRKSYLKLWTSDIFCPITVTTATEMGTNVLCRDLTGETIFLLLTPLKQTKCGWMLDV